MRFVLIVVVVAMVSIGTYWLGKTHTVHTDTINAPSIAPVQPSRGAAPGTSPAAPANVPEAGTATQLAQGYRMAANRARPSVVNVYTAKRVGRSDGNEQFPLFGVVPPGDENVSSSLGSGVIVSAEGFILTNNHVIEGAEEIAVAFPGGKTLPATLVGADPESDLAVLKVKTVNLIPIAFGDSEALQVGDVVLAVGDPFGVGQTVTQGIVSATGRNRVGINTYENFIQTDAAINPGNSGGALVDVEGKLVGINSAIFSRSGGFQGIGFAIPVSLAREVMDQIIAKGRVDRGWLGIQAEDVTPEIAEAIRAKAGQGAVVSGVARGGPAERAGLKPGDVVNGINGKAISDSAAMVSATAALPPGTLAKLDVLRAGRPIGIEVTLGRRPPVKRP